MRLNKITVDIAVSLIHRAALSRGGDHVQKMCVNVSKRWDDAGVLIYEPECIVGLALWLHGVTGEEFDAGANCGASAFGLMSELKNQQVVEIDPDALKLFSMAQSLQDNGMAWGNVEKAVLAAARHCIQ